MKLTHFQCDSSILTKSKKLSNSQAVDQANLERNVNKLLKLASNKKEAEKNIFEINNTILKIKISMKILVEEYLLELMYQIYQ